MKTIVKIACLLCALILFPVLCHAAQTASQNAVPGSAKIAPSQPVASVAVSTPALPAPLTEEGILRESQRQFDRSMTLLGYVIDILGLILAAFAASFIYFEYKGYSSRKELESLMADAKKSRDAIEQNKKITDELRLQLENTPFPQDKMTPEYKLKVDDMIRRLDFMEMMGVALKPQDYSIRALELYSSGKYEECIALLDKVLASNPKDSNTWISKGVTLGKLGKDEEALKAYDKAIELKPDDAAAWLSKGARLGKLSRHDEALKAYDKAIELKPDFVKAWFNKGAALGERGKHDEALKAYDKAIELKPDYVEAWSNKGVIFEKLGKHDEALKAYDKAIELKPDFAEAWSNKGGTLMKLGRHEEAIKACDKAVELNPKSSDAYYNRACAYALFANKDLALADLKVAVKLDIVLKQKAKSDEDFKSLWEDEDFKKIVNS